MRPTQHPSNTRVLGAPAGWNQQRLPCNALPVTEFVIDGQQAIVSFWRPTGEERAAIAAGGLVQLAIVGGTMPPVALEVVQA